MKLIIAALNAKYVHTSLSVRCLKNSVMDICNCQIREYTINDTVDSIASDIYLSHPDCVAFSCYIWNIELCLRIASVLKKANPGINIVLGGHEVSYDAEAVLKSNPYVDAVLCGEGEITLRAYVSALINGDDLDGVYSAVYRKGNDIVTNPVSDKLCDLNALKFPYDDSIDDIKDKIIYYETSRGCPYGCTYCISGEGSRVRFLDTERVKRELEFFISHKVGLVKFVDRTFNANPRRAKEIFKFIADNPSDTCFHMELAGDIIDDETVEILSKVKKDTLRFEIGVQTTNPETMSAIERKISFQKLSDTVTKLINQGNVHVHLDLIAGLPGEDLASFKRSFDDVLSLRPHVLQLGFLKLLKGSKIRAHGENYGYVYSDCAPYEVISNQSMTYDDILELKEVEGALERYYNSGRFRNSMEVLFEIYESKYDVFRKIGRYFAESFESGYAFSGQKLYDVLFECFIDCGSEFADALKKDYLSNLRVGKRPYWFGEADSTLVQKAYDLFRDEEYKKIHMPHYYDIPAKEIMKHIYAERFTDCVLLFDYKMSKVYDVTDII